MASAPHKIFFSYSQAEAPFASAVADELRHQGVDAWTAETHVLPGSEWVQAIDGALRSSEYVVVFVGANAKSPRINFEIGAAVGGDKSVVPIYLSEAARRDAPGLLLDYQGIDAQDLKPDEVAQRIASVIRAAA